MRERWVSTQRSVLAGRPAHAGRQQWQRRQSPPNKKACLLACGRVCALRHHHARHGHPLLQPARQRICTRVQEEQREGYPVKAEGRRRRQPAAGTTLQARRQPVATISCHLNQHQLHSSSASARCGSPGGRARTFWSATRAYEPLGAGIDEPERSAERCEHRAGRRPRGAPARLACWGGGGGRRQAVARITEDRSEVLRPVINIVCRRLTEFELLMSGRAHGQLPSTTLAAPRGRRRRSTLAGRRARSAPKLGARKALLAAPQHKRVVRGTSRFA